MKTDIQDKRHFYLLMILKLGHIQRATFNKINKRMNEKKKCENRSIHSRVMYGHT